MALKRVGTDNPLCCQASNPTGPCEYQAEPGSQFCGLHAGGGASAAKDRQELRNYKLNALYGKRAKELGDSTAIKSLNDEIALLRTTLEVTVNNIKNDTELILHTDRIEKLAKAIKDLIESLQKIQEKNKELLSRDMVMSIFDKLMEKIVERVPDPDVIKQLAEDGYGIITKGLGG